MKLSLNEKNTIKYDKQAYFFQERESGLPAYLLYYLFCCM